jgi:trk system potassium uptake protein TrkH
LYYKDGGTLSFLFASITTLVIGLILFVPFKNISNENVTHREGFFITTSSWILIGIAGGLPFFFQRTFGDMNFASFASGIFESISGLTTTGATVLENIESHPHSILMWRSTTHWIGGMGFIVLSLTMLPFLGIGGFQLFKAEVPGPTQEKITPRIRETAKILWKLYFIITLALVILLLFGGMSLFDAINHAFATLATGGFSTKNKSIESFDSAYIEAVITFFMIVAGANFSLHYYAIFKGDVKKYLKDSEFKIYMYIFLGLSFVAGLDIYLRTGKFFYALRHAPFNIASILTTTGFNSVDFTDYHWGKFATLAIVVAMMVGGSAGSTGGGVKVIRIILIFKQSIHELYRLIFPDTVNSVKFDKIRIKNSLALNVWGFVYFYVLTLMIISVIIYISGHTYETSFFATLASVGNIGPGISDIGPTENYTLFASWIKLLLSFGMLLGRLEIYTILVLFSSHFWRR